MALSKIVCFTLLAVFFFLSASDLQAPETTGRDIFGFDPHRIAPDGSVVASDGAIRGWVRGDALHDAQWNVTHRMNGHRLCKVDED